MAVLRFHRGGWWDSTDVGAVRVTATPARHASGRRSSTTNAVLWAGYALAGPVHRVWYSGDTGFHDGLAEIGERLGPFDVTLIDAGQYDALWPDAHLGPELAVEAHRLVGGRVMIPVHWGLLELAPHTWTEPVERVLRQAACRAVDVVPLQPGRATDPFAGAGEAQWWPALSWAQPAANPVLGTRNGDAHDRYAAAPCAAADRRP